MLLALLIHPALLVILVVAIHPAANTGLLGFVFPAFIEFTAAAAAARQPPQHVTLQHLLLAPSKLQGEPQLYDL